MRPARSVLAGSPCLRRLLDAAAGQPAWPSLARSPCARRSTAAAAVAPPSSSSTSSAPSPAQPMPPHAAPPVHAPAGEVRRLCPVVRPSGPAHDAGFVRQCVDTIAAAFAAGATSTPFYIEGPATTDGHAFWHSMVEEVLEGVPPSALMLHALPDASAASLCYAWSPDLDVSLARTQALVRRGPVLLSWQRLGAFWERMEHAAYAAHGPFYDVSFLAVRPDLARGGLGRRVLHDILAYADETGRPVFLAADGPTNRDWYARYGFKPLEQSEYTETLDGVPGGLHITFMVRPAAAATAVAAAASTSTATATA